MNLITLDFETFYTKDVGFKKMTTEEYVRHPEFHVIGVGTKVNDGVTEWYSGSHGEVKQYLSSLTDWSDAALLCHNTLFDGCILAWHFGIKPKLYLDTLCMARAIHGVEAGGSLKALAERYELGVKGTEVDDAIGLARGDFTPDALARYGEYCKNDVQLTFDLFGELASSFPEDELKLIDMTLRMFIDPVFYVDDALLTARLEEIRVEKSTLLQGLMQRMECDTEEAVRKKLASNKQFGVVLEELGIKPPMKVSKTTGKDTLALAKNDEGFLALTEHEDPFIQQLCAVRLGTKSTIEESRIARFIDIGARNKGLLPIPLKYYGAHTGRWAGSDKVNFQNLPSRDKKKKALKNAVMAPDGYEVINCDSSQIEARVLAWLAGQDDLVEAFAKGDDVYSLFASKIYGRPISKADPVERFVGKTCIAEGTLVLSHQGWKRIETITTDDLLWDGQEWVCHQGLLNNGIKPTLNMCGAWMTPDHQVWSGTQWLEAQSVVADEDTLYRALDTGAGNLPSQAMFLESEVGSVPSWSNATATKQSTESITTTSKILKVLAALFAPRKQQLRNAIGCTAKQWRMMPIGLAYSIVSLRQSLGATPQITEHTSITESGVSGYVMSGATTEQRSYGTYRRSTVGITQFLRWIGSMWTGTMNRGILGSYREAITSTINARSQISKRVYDILNSGSRNRFTILTEAGPLIVHNCILGLGYGTGALKLQHTLKTSPPGADLTEEQCKNIVSLYRETNDKIIELWRDGDDVIKDLAHWYSKPTAWYYYGRHDCLRIDKSGVRLPNGLYIRYPNLYLNTDEDKSRYMYKSRKGPVSMWGGSLVENVVQALARIIVGEQMLKINERYRVVLTVHDSVVIIVRKSEAKEAQAYIESCMQTAPDWAAGLPVACESGRGDSYGDT